VACFAELLEMGADLEGSPANERLTRQVQQFTTVRAVTHEALQRAVGKGDIVMQAGQCWGMRKDALWRCIALSVCRVTSHRESIRHCKDWP